MWAAQNGQANEEPPRKSGLDKLAGKFQRKRPPSNLQREMAIYESMVIEEEDSFDLCAFWRAQTASYFLKILN